MPYFFFGTLMDPDVRRVVLDRWVDPLEIRRGWIEHFRRVWSEEASYPLLVRAPGNLVEGRVLMTPTGRDARRIRHFEDDEYIETATEVRCETGHSVRARFFRATSRLRATSSPWELIDWAQIHKPGYLELCRKWMEDCPD